MRACEHNLCTKHRHSDWDQSMSETNVQSKSMNLRFWDTFCIWFENQFIKSDDTDKIFVIAEQKTSPFKAYKWQPIPPKKECERYVDSCFSFVLFVLCCRQFRFESRRFLRNFAPKAEDSLMNLLRANGQKGKRVTSIGELKRRNGTQYTHVRSNRTKKEIQRKSELTSEEKKADGHTYTPTSHNRIKNLWVLGKSERTLEIQSKRQCCGNGKGKGNEIAPFLEFQWQICYWWNWIR